MVSTSSAPQRQHTQLLQTHGPSYEAPLHSQAHFLRILSAISFYLTVAWVPTTLGLTIWKSTRIRYAVSILAVEVVFIFVTPLIASAAHRLTIRAALTSDIVCIITAVFFDLLCVGLMTYYCVFQALVVTADFYASGIVCCIIGLSIFLKIGLVYSAPKGRFLFH